MHLRFDKLVFETVA